MFVIYFRQSLAEQLKKVRTAKVADRKRTAKLSAEQKATLSAKRAEKQVSRFLLPDAPPPKRQNRFEDFPFKYSLIKVVTICLFYNMFNCFRKTSPERIACPLLPGVPVTPPPRKPQPWETRRDLGMNKLFNLELLVFFNKVTFI